MAFASRPDGGAELFDGDGDALVWDAHRDDPSLAFALSRLTLAGGNAAPIGIFRSVERPVYDDELGAQLEAAKQKKGEGDSPPSSPPATPGRSADL